MTFKLTKMTLDKPNNFKNFQDRLHWSFKIKENPPNFPEKVNDKLNKLFAQLETCVFWK